MRIDVLSATLVLLGVAAPPLVAQDDALGRKLETIEQRYRDSLVRVRYRQQVRRSTAEPPEEEELTTTGVVVSSDGVVMVSAIVYEPFNQVPHGVGIRFPGSVARGEAEIESARVQFVDGTEVPATLLGRDPRADVAFFRADVSGRELSPVAFRAGEPPSVGQQLAVVSLLPEPLGPALSVELARVQATTSRPRPGFLVGTSATDPVGSIVVDLDGEIAGYLDAITVPVPDTRSRNPLAFLTVMRDLPKGVGRAFARPAAELAGASASLADREMARRGWLGIEMQALSKKLADHMAIPAEGGLLIGYVYHGSPAEEAGLEVGDVLVELDGAPIDVQREEDIGTFAEKILRAGPGAELRFEVLRDGQRHMRAARLVPAPRSAREAETLEVRELDLTVRELTYDYRATRFLSPDQEGVVVVEAPLGVSSNVHRVAPGDLLLRLADRDVGSIERLREVLDDIRSEEPEEVVLFVERGRESFFFAVKPDWD